MLEVLISMLKKEKRLFERKLVSYTVACKPSKFFYHDHKGLLGSDEILTKTEDISNGGMCIRWPFNFKCHFCKHRIDLGKWNSCEVNECNFEMKGFKVGADMIFTMQIQGNVIEDIKAKIVWYKEPETNREFYGRLGVKFYQKLDIV